MPAFTLSFDLANLADLNAFLAGRSYLVGFKATQTDVELFTALGKAPDAAKFPHVARFYTHIASLSAEQRAKLPAALGAKAAVAAAPAAAAAPAPKAGGAAAAAADDDDLADMFGDDADKAEAVTKKAAAAPAPAPAPAAAAKAKKPEIIAKSQITYQFSPVAPGQDMDALANKLRESVAMDGLVWNKNNIVEDVGYGLQTLTLAAIIEDEKVGLDALENAFNDLCIPEDEEEIEDETSEALIARHAATGKYLSSYKQLSMDKISGR